MNRLDALRSLRGKLASGRMTTGMCCTTAHPMVVEIAGQANMDFVILDIEHFAVDKRGLEDLIRAAEAHDLVSIVKLKRIDEVDVRDALDFGALGIMAPHIHGPEDVRALIEMAFFPPRGKRGVCGAARANYYSAGDLREMVAMTEELLIIPIIEDASAVDSIDEILAVDERIDIYDIGPVDLALSMGLDLDRSISNPSPELQVALDRAIGAIKAAGMHLMYPTRFPNHTSSGPALAAWMKERGVSMIYGFDTHSLVRGARDIGALRE